ncbi:MAG: cobalt-precorrin-6A reductase, partial [Pseudomonadota bacterium]
VARPVRQPLPQRVGGFGGADGLFAYLKAENVTHVIDATHPFARQMSANAVAACATADIPLIAYTRAPWTPQSGDKWTTVEDVAGAVAALNRPPARVMLAVGRLNLPAFEANPQHFYLLRLVDPPKTPPRFPEHHVVIARGAFSEEGDLALMREHRIDLVVSKNSGGTGGAAKVAAARALGLPVIMIRRPALPERREAFDLDAVIAWIGHASTDLGV